MFAGLFPYFATNCNASTLAYVTSTEGSDSDKTRECVHVEQRIHVGDWTPGGVALRGSTTGREAGQSSETADPSGPMGGAMSVTRTSLAPLGGTPSVSAAIPVRSGAGCRR